MPPAAQAQPEPLGYQEGSRWINERPTGEAVASWFKENVPLHDGLDPGKYVSGVTLIGGQEKIKVPQRDAKGTVTFPDVSRYSWTPYAKVETRVAYFWDLMATREQDWVGIIEPVEVPRISDQGVYNLNMPPGFFRLPVQGEDGQFAHFICCSMRIRVLQRGTVEKVHRVRKTVSEEGEVFDETFEGYDGIPVGVYPPATKMIAQIGNYGVDPFSMMKAETGAVGRALGMAGMLVIPGSGIATAEDMQEAIAGAGSALAPQLPEPAAEQEPLAADVGNAEDVIQEKIAQLQSVNPEGFEELAAWAKERKINLTDIKDHQRRGVLLQVERKLGIGQES